MKKTVLFLAVMLYALLGISQNFLFNVHVLNYAQQAIENANVYYTAFMSNSDTIPGSSSSNVQGVALINFNDMGQSVDSIYIHASADGYYPNDTIITNPANNDTADIFLYYADTLSFLVKVSDSNTHSPIEGASVQCQAFDGIPTSSSFYTNQNGEANVQIKYAQNSVLDSIFIDVEAQDYLSFTEGFGDPSSLDTLNVNLVPFDSSFFSFFFLWTQDASDPHVVRFTPMLDLGQIPDSNSYDLNWDFGDDSQVTSGIDSAISHTYDVLTAYVVTMSIPSLNLSFSDSVILENYYPDTINYLADFYYYPLDSTFTTYQFINSSFGNIVSYNWDFGDGAISNDENPIHSYSDAGLYHVALAIETGDGFFDSIEYPVWVGAQEVWYPDTAQALFYTTYLGGTDVQFNDISYSNTDIAERYWNFGDGDFAYSVASPIHSYPDTGVYTVIYRIITVVGDTSSYTQDIHVTGAEDTSLLFFPDTVNTGKSAGVGFRNVTGRDGSDWVWNFGDSKTSRGSKDLMIQHDYANSGQYHVTAINSSGSGYAMDIYVSVGNKSNNKVTLIKGYALNKGQTTNISTVIPQQISIYPNPVSDRIYVEIPDNDTYNVMIFDASGRNVYNNNLNGSRIAIDVNNLSSGVYTVRISNANNVYTSKFVK